MSRTVVHIPGYEDFKISIDLSDLDTLKVKALSNTSGESKQGPLVVAASDKMLSDYDVRFVPIGNLVEMNILTMRFTTYSGVAALKLAKKLVREENNGYNARPEELTLL